MLRCAKDYGLKVRAFTTTWSRLARTPMPALAILNDGSYLLLGKIGEDKLLVQAPHERPRQMTRQELEAIWGGRLVLMTKRRSLTDLARRFDVTWFLGAIHKYRHRLAEVLLASFFLQLFGLVSPLFFQMVIDKVLVHRSISTLDVLLIGLVAIAVFEGGAGHPADLCVLAYDQPDRRRTWAPGCSAICWRCRSPISSRAASAIRSRACASWRTSATS